MKKSLISKLFATALAISSLGTITLIATPSNAQTTLFASAEVDQNRFVIAAIPSSINNLHQLVIIEQIAATRNCWSESGSNPTIVNPLLLQFNFTGICGRSTDSNGYSIRMGGQDLGVSYNFSFVRAGNDLVLIGSDPFNPTGPKIEIGRTNGLSQSPMKINLNPGWRLTRRTYEGLPLGHVYLTNNRTLSQVVADSGGTTISGITDNGITINSGATGNGTNNSGTTSCITTNNGTTNSGAGSSGTTNSGTTNSGITNNGTTNNRTTNSGITNNGTTNNGTTTSSVSTSSGTPTGTGATGMGSLSNRTNGSGITTSSVTTNTAIATSGGNGTNTGATGGGNTSSRTSGSGTTTRTETASSSTELFCPPPGQAPPPQRRGWIR
jgi:hypothetical protein